MPLEGILVAGWAYVQGGPLGEVEIFVDGQSRGLARIGIQREDIERIDRSANALLSGFELLVDAPGVTDRIRGSAPGEVSIRVVARQHEGPSFVVAEESFPIIQRAPATPTPPAAPSDGSRLTAPVAPGLSLYVVAHDLNLGGAQLWLLELLRHSGAGRDFPCTVRADTEGPMRSAFEELGISVEICGRAPIKRWSDYDAEARRLARRIETGNFNAVLLNTFGTFIGADAARRVGVPSVWGIHESWAPPMFWIAAYGPKGIDPRVEQAALEALKTCPAVIFEAAATRDLYLPWTQPGAAHVIPYGVDTDAADRFCATTSREAARERLGLPLKGRILLSMGTIERRKGQTLLAQAFAQVANDHRDAHLAFVGDTHSAYSAALRRCIAESQLKDRVSVHPVTPDIFSWYRASDVLVCASDIESLPRSVLDAMSFGTAILATSVFGLPEVLSDGETGFLYSSNSLPAAVDALDRVLQLEPDLIADVATAGRDLVRKNHRAEGYGQTIRKVLGHLVAGSGPIDNEVTGLGS